jgi:predicted alpha/beta superfamily hydrolase/imidazolonepropionase-like amidohydrolase
MKRFLVVLWLSGLAWAQEPVALVNATVHPGPGQAAVQAPVMVRAGRIERVGGEVPAGCPTVSLTGLHLYPGLVESDSQLGLIEIESVRGGSDVREVGDNNADLAAEIALNPDSDLLPVARSAGILTAALQPGGGRIGGQVAVMQLYGWTPAEMRLAASPGVVVQWPVWASEEDAKARKRWKEQLAQLEDWICEARAWGQLPLAQRPVRPELEALARALQGGRLFIRAQSRFQIETAAQFCKRLAVRWVLVGGAEAASVAPLLAQHKVDVIYTEVYRLPQQDYVDCDAYYRTPARLSAAGVRVALAGPGSHDNARWLTEMAAAAWAHGWSQQEAVDAITSVPCDILGLTDQGRVAAGQRATLIACNGPLLDGRTQVVRAWVQGQEISLEDRQKNLYRKYRNKPRLIPSSNTGDNQTMIRQLPPSSSVPARSRTLARSAELPAASEVYEPGPPAWGQSMTGDIRYHEVTSKILGNTRPVWVYLPPGYAAHPEQKYPVVYAMDGQNVFEKGTAFGGNEWHMDEAAQQAMSQGRMREAIIVAVSNAGAGRIEEYSPVADPQYGGGGAEKFAQFLKTELKPMVDGAYRTQPAAENTAVLGSSMGGLVSLYLGLAHSNTFGLIGALSPSLWFAEKDMLRSWADHPPQSRPQRIWLDMGDRESQNDADHNGVADTLDNTRRLNQLLESQQQSGLLYREVAGGTHTEAAWSARIQQVLEGLLPLS